jgi:DNA-binding NarL/FixJ family response regulator
VADTPLTGPLGSDGETRDDSAVAVTAVIVDDHAGFRAMARRMLEDEGYSVIGEAADGEGAIEVVRALRPRVVLLDIQLPDVDGFAVARRLADAGGDEVVVLTSTRNAEDYGSRLAASPADGFISKADLSGPALARMLGRA